MSVLQYHVSPQDAEAVRACVYFCFWEVAFDFEVFFPIFPEGKDKTPIKSSGENCSNHFS